MDEHLIQDLDKLAIWLERWKMAFYPYATSYLSFKNKNRVKFNYSLHGHLLGSLEEAKYVGITIR